MYEIVLNGVCVGTAELKKEGLFYRIFCTCRPPARAVYRVVVNDGNDTTDLGICVPNGKEFTLIARVPIKRLRGNPLLFTLTECKAKANSFFAPVKNGELFPYLDKLESARLQNAAGQTVIVIDPE